LDADNKKTFDNLISSVKSKVESMQKAKQEAEKKQEENTEDPTPFLKTWKGILLIGVIIVAVLGAIAYFIKTNSSEEGEGE